MGRVISISNQKGGVGKTTTAINLSAFLAEKGKRVLIIDFDPQANAGYGLGINVEEMETTIYEVLIGKIKIEDSIYKTGIENLYIVPSNIQLSGAQIDLLYIEGKEAILKKSIQKIKGNFDYIFIDCPPSLGILTLNSLVAADTVMIPLQCEYYALEGLSQLLKTVNAVRSSLNASLDLAGILLTMFDSRNNLSLQVAEDIRQHFKEAVFHTIIPRNVRLSEAPSYGKPALLYDIKSSGAQSYLALAKELIGRGVRHGHA